MSDCKHGSIPSHCPYCRITELQATIAEAENELNAAEATIKQQAEDIETVVKAQASSRVEVAELREAARAVVESDADARRQQVTHWKNPTIDALAALLEKNDE